MEDLKFFLLGMPLVTLGDISVEGFVSDKALALLCYLALEMGNHSRDNLAGLFWGEMSEDRAKANLRMALYNLQHLLPGFLIVSRTTVSRNPDAPLWVDVTQFLSAIKAGPVDFKALRSAVDLYRGDFLKGLFVEESPEFEAWLLNRREHIKLTALQAMEHLVNHYFVHRELDQAIDMIRRILSIEPWHEAAHRQLMEALARKGEYAAALVQYETCQRILAKEIGVAPAPETVALYERITQIRQQPNRHNLPAQPTPLVGREAELNKLRRLLANPDCRLLTLVGTGGIGKTRIALQAAQDQVGSFLEGVYFVSLAGVGSADLLATAILSALGLELRGMTSPVVQLFDYLRGKEILLILDNFEHLLEGASLLADLLQQAPQTKILVTSRERLNLHSEWVFPVQGLPYPEPGTNYAIEEYSAVALYTLTARRTKASFTMDESEQPCVAHICQLVEGMPLALELAASWIRSLTCEDIASEIERSIGILASRTRDLPERHRSIRAVFDQSWKLLTEKEQSVLRRLSVFRGGFTREEAEQVTEASLMDLSSLADKSLLQISSQTAETQRYDLHELVRQYAGEMLQASGELENIQDRHLIYFAEYAKSADRAVHTGEFGLWLVRLEAEIDNLRAALTWGLATPRGPEVGLILAGELGWYWYFANHWREGQDWAERMLSLEGADDFPLARAKALFTAGGLALLLDDYPTAERCMEESENLFRIENDQRGLAYTLCAWAIANLNQGNVVSAQRMEEESVALFEAIHDRPGYLFALGIFGDVLLYLGEYESAKVTIMDCIDLSQELDNPVGLAYALLNLGEIVRWQGDDAAAEAHLKQSIEIAQAAGVQRFQAMGLHYLGRVAQSQGRPEEARSNYMESLRLFHELGDVQGTTACLEELAGEAGVQEQAERAVRLFAAAANVREAINIPAPLPDREAVARAVASLRVGLDSASFEKAWAEGSAMTLVQAINYALEEDN